VDRLLWASDFPHPDTTWPDSRGVVADHLAGLPEDVRDRIVRQNATARYGIGSPA
jgi:predicted TIM-barrel fold metal-dependent hydrolase